MNPIVDTLMCFFHSKLPIGILAIKIDTVKRDIQPEIVAEKTLDQENQTINFIKNGRDFL